MRTKLTLSLIFVSVAIIAFCMIFLVEQYESEQWTGPSTEAARNPFLAAQRFLSHRDVDVIKTKDILDFDQIPPQQTVLITEVDSMLVSPRQVKAAKAWIKKGGYLIAAANKVSLGEVSLLKEFDIETYPVEKDQLDDWFLSGSETQKPSERLREINEKIEADQLRRKKGSSDRDKQGVDSKADHSSTLQQILEAKTQTEYFLLNVSKGLNLHLAVLDKVVFDHPHFYHRDRGDHGSKPYTLETWRSDEHGTRLIQFKYGEGALVVLSSAKMWENDYIGLADHAYFLSYLVPDESTLQLFYNVTTPPLIDLIYHHFRYAVWAIIFLLILWLWRSAARVQPFYPNLDGTERMFAEHLKSSAEFLASYEQYSALLEPIRVDIESRCKKLATNFASLTEHDQIIMLSKSSKLPATAIESWFAYCQKIDNREQLIDAVRLGQAILQRL